MFGDIDLEAHREWVEGVCAEPPASRCHLPLWQEPRRRLIDELLAGGVAGHGRGRRRRPARRLVSSDARIGEALVADLEAAGADACGEEGEYHTMVTEAPLFARPVPLAWDGHVSRDGHWILAFSTRVAEAEAGSRREQAQT